MVKKGYIAGKLFKQGDIKQRLYEGQLVKQELPNIDFYNPIENDEINDKKNLPTAKDIFYGDTDRVLESNVILAELDDEDSGTIYEIGICHGIEILRERLINLKDDNPESSIDEILKLLEKEVPKKKIYAHLSDIRLTDAHNYRGKYIPHGLNQFVVGAIEEIGNIYSTVEDAIESIKEE
ncbi:MAG: nucleoside 2-deoxyribosyltransferase [Tissierellaceae bacterium]|nr:nucleoside 2-deoxyribosyltransferase [Tissierellaceae bacterium]